MESNQNMSDNIIDIIQSDSMIGYVLIELSLSALPRVIGESIAFSI